MPADMSQQIGVWVAALLTLAIFSFLYRDNPLYKLAEHLFVGVGMGYSIAYTYQRIILPDMIWPLFRPAEVERTSPDYLVLIPIAIGLLWFARFLPRGQWLMRLPVAFVVGWASGQGLVAAIHGQLLPQIEATLRPILPGGAGESLVTWPDALGHLLILVGVACTLTYFFFSKEHRGLFGFVGRIGIWFLMVAFGAAFGYTVMARVSLLIGRVQFLLHDWLHLI